MRKTKTTKTIINILKNMIDWAKMEGLLPESTPNKFLEYSQQINKLKIPPKDKPELIKKVERTYNKSFNPTREYWSEDEVKIILSELNDRRKHTLYYQQCDVYALLIEFLFATGMRHGEAFGLTFGKIQGDLSNSEVPIKLVINESYNSKYRVIKETKTKKNRVILLSKRAHEIVKQLYEFYTTLGINVNINTSIFCKENGSNFTTADITSLWLGASTKDKVSYMGMIPRLCVEGKLPFYLKPYSTRSTFVSLQSQRNIDPQTVADYIGDNVETIFKHYYGGRDDYQPIDLF